MLHKSASSGVFENTREVDMEITRASRFTSAFASSSSLTISSPSVPILMAAINGVDPCSPATTTTTCHTRNNPPFPLTTCEDCSLCHGGNDGHHPKILVGVGIGLKHLHTIFGEIVVSDQMFSWF